MPESPPDDDSVTAIQTGIRGATADPEAMQPPAKLLIFDGATSPEKPGPAGYFVRTEGTTNTRIMMPGSIEEVLEELFGSESEMTNFIVGSNSHEAIRDKAERLREKLNNPAMQRRIRMLHAEQQRLKRELNE